jgi:8-oxo-dGTP diphosphatase
MSYNYKYPRPAVTVDAVVIYWNTEAWQHSRPLLLLVQRKKEPFQGKWAFPGGFLEIEEEPKTGALRELKEETGLELQQLHQVQAFGKVDRDPRGRTISIAYLGLIHEGDLPSVKADSDAGDARWFPIDELPEMAFDHRDILKVSCLRLNSFLKADMEDQHENFDIPLKVIPNWIEKLKELV